MNVLNRISTIEESILWAGMNSINLIVKDIGCNYFHATYNRDTKTFVDFKTREVIQQPIGWIRLPTMDPDIEEQEIETLYP